MSGHTYKPGDLIERRIGHEWRHEGRTYVGGWRGRIVYESPEQPEPQHASPEQVRPYTPPIEIPEDTYKPGDLIEALSATTGEWYEAGTYIATTRAGVVVCEMANGWPSTITPDRPTRPQPPKWGEIWVGNLTGERVLIIKVSTEVVRYVYESGAVLNMELSLFSEHFTREEQP